MTTPELIKRASAPLTAAALLLALAAPAGAQAAADGGRGDGGQTVRTEQVTEADDGDGDAGLADDGDNAHPSRNDRSVEPGGSGNQGRAAHDPDDDERGPDRSYGGLDQPGGPGGVDLEDQDGNNGCGNDDDFEDDNEGWCGKPPAVEGTEVEAETETENETEVETVVGGEVVEREQAPEVGEAAEDDDDSAVPPATAVRGSTRDRGARAAAVPETEVMGVSVTRSLGALATGTGAAPADAASGELPRTGAGLLALAGFGLGIAGVGAVVTRLGRVDGTA